jgi:presenilin-like A22 family membrane protease
MLARMEVEARPGYELWRPNRAKSETKVTRVLVALVLLISAGLILIITLGGWDRLQGATVAAIAVAWAVLYIVFAFLVLRWSRGILPVAAALAIILAIFAVIAAPAWFARDKEGLTSPALPEELLGLLTFLVVPVQLALIAVAMVGFNQNWHVEEERPVGGGDYDDSPPDVDDQRSAAAPA